MNDADELLASLHRSGIKLWVRDGRLHYRSAAGALSADDIVKIRSHKAALIDSLRRGADGAIHSVSLLGRDRPDVGALSHAQERLWFLDRLSLVGAAYNVPVIFELTGRLNVPTLESALSRLIERHEALRTRYESSDGEVRPLIEAEVQFKLTLVDLSDLPFAQREAELRRLVDEELRQPFDLERGPLFRASLLKLNQRKHVLRMGLHHIIADGWSVDVLVRDLGSFYSTGLQGAEASLPALPVQYSDYVHWQRRRLQDGALQEQLQYWRDQLRDAPELLELPTDRSRPAVASFRGAEVRLELGRNLAEAVKRLAAREEVTPYMVLLATFQLLLWRWSGQSDVVVGSPIAGRTDRALEQLIGFFVNTLLLRTRLRPVESFRSLLSHVKQMALQAYAHQDVPFAKLVAELQPARNLSFNPLFQVTFSFHSAADATLSFAGIELTPVHGDHISAKFDLSLYVSQAPDSLLAVFEYATDLFDRDTIERLAKQFRTLLDAVVTEPQRRLDEFPLWTARERDEWLAKLISTQARYDTPRCIQDVISDRARCTPHAIAVVCDGGNITYEELTRRSNQLAQHLRSCGARGESIIGVSLERSLDMVVALLGVLKAGAAYLPLDPAYPADRLAYMIDDARVSVLITQSTHDDALARLPLRRILLDRDALAIAEQPNCAPSVDASSDQLAYVIYTSGSTGNPKGVMVSHRNVLRLFAASESRFQFGPQDVWTLFHSYAFDFSVWEIFGALLYGGQLVVVSHLTARSPQQFYELLMRERVTVLNQTPSAFRQLLQLAADEPDRFTAGSLRLVIFGGEALDVASLRPWFSATAPERCSLVNMYGITETTVHVTYRLLTVADTQTSTSSPVGEPLTDLQVYVLDERLNVVPPGITGEIYVGGEGLARGYLNRPALTAERFVANPYGPPGCRLYRSGDLARYRANGEVEFIGRADGQVKLRGHRIELGEIQACLSRMAGVRDALIRVVGGETQRLVAWLVPAPGENIDPAHCRAELAGRLPAFMIPSELILIPALPLTVNGKLDVSRLPVPDLRDREERVDYVPPVTVAEQVLTTIWEETLGVVRAGTNDNFFALGGDSIRAVQIVRAAAGRGVTVTVADIFRHQTICELARASGGGEARRAALPLELLKLPVGVLERFPLPITDAYPLTSMQELMVRHYAENHRHGLGVYHVQQCLHVHDAMPSSSAMRDAIQKMIDAQPVLRTVMLRSSDGTLIQGILRASQVDFEMVDLSSLGAIDQQREIDRAMLVDRRSVFATDGATPLLRFRWWQIARDEFRLLMTIHHAIDDGWGNQHFLKLLFESYRQLRQGHECSLTPAENVFKQFVALEREMALADDAARFWNSQLLQPMGRSSLPRLTRRQNTQGLELIIGQELTRRLQALSRRRGVSLKAVLLSAFTELLAAHLGVSRVTVGVVANGRSDRLSEPLVALGLFWNLVPFCSSDEPGTGFDRIRFTQRALATIEPYATYPLTRIAQSRGVDELFFATFNFVNFHNAAHQDIEPGLALLDIQGHDKFHFPLNYLFAVVRTNSVIAVVVQYDNEYFDDATVAGMNTRLLEVLQRYVHDAQPVAAT